MGVFSKLKNIFYDEEIIEEPDLELKKVDKDVKKVVEEPQIEEIKVIKPAPVEELEEKPKVEEPKPVEETVSERELFRNERKFNFTELDDEDELPSRRNVLNTENRTRVAEPTVNVQLETPKVFKPSPVISPIYGILDKDYTKEEVITKQESTYKELDTPATKYDSVRRKAYGTLEDDLEDTLNSMNKITPEVISEEVDKIDSTIDELDEKTSKIEDILNKIEDSTSEDVSVGELEDKLEIEHFDEDEEEEVKEEPAVEDELVDKTMTDSTLEHDLFNLIDSMYDKEE